MARKVLFSSAGSADALQIVNVAEKPFRVLSRLRHAEEVSWSMEGLQNRIIHEKADRLNMDSVIFCSRGRQVRDTSERPIKKQIRRIVLEEVEPHESGHCSWRTISRL